MPLIDVLSWISMLGRRFCKKLSVLAWINVLGGKILDYLYTNVCQHNNFLNLHYKTFLGLVLCLLSYVCKKAQFFWIFKTFWLFKQLKHFSIVRTIKNARSLNLFNCSNNSKCTLFKTAELFEQLQNAHCLKLFNCTNNWKMHIV